VVRRREIDRGRWFFMHIPKTGGSTLNAHITNNFSASEIWPAHEPMRRPLSVPALYTDVSRVRSMSVASRAKTRLYRGHFPLRTVELLGRDVVVLTVLREPVTRTVSWLDHCRRNNPEHHDLSFEQIYDDEWFTVRYAQNLQTKLFAMTLEEACTQSSEIAVEATSARRIYQAIGCSLNVVVQLDDARFADAQSGLQRVDVLGVTERYDDLCARLAHLGWEVGAVAPRNVGEPNAISNALRRRIIADNAYDMELYQRALERVEGRGESPPTFPESAGPASIR
jgi:hypothetical protein